jgi:hypothetical protein
MIVFYWKFNILFKKVYFKNLKKEIFEKKVDLFTLTSRTIITKLHISIFFIEILLKSTNIQDNISLF